MSIDYITSIYWSSSFSRFINLQASAIRKLYQAQNKEPLITASSFNIISNTFQWNCKNLYHDYCLNISGGADDVSIEHQGSGMLVSLSDQFP